MITVTLAPLATHSRQCSKVRLAGAFTSGGKLSVKKRICKSTPTQSNLSISILQVHRNALGRQNYPKLWSKGRVLKSAQAVVDLYRDQPAISQLEMKNVWGNLFNTDIGMHDKARHSGQAAP